MATKSKKTKKQAAKKTTPVAKKPTVVEKKASAKKSKVTGTPIKKAKPANKKSSTKKGQTKTEKYIFSSSPSSESQFKGSAVNSNKTKVSTNTSLVVSKKKPVAKKTNNNNSSKIIFNDYDKFLEATNQEHEKIVSSEEKIELLRLELERLNEEIILNKKAKKLPAPKQESSFETIAREAAKGSGHDDKTFKELYAVEIETLRVAFDVLDKKDRQIFIKKIPDMIKHLIQKNIIDKK